MKRETWLPIVLLNIISSCAIGMAYYQFKTSHHWKGIIAIVCAIALLVATYKIFIHGVNKWKEDQEQEYYGLTKLRKKD